MSQNGAVEISTAPAFIDDATVARVLAPAEVLAVIARAFDRGLVAPQRLVAESAESGDRTRTMLVMPAIRAGGVASVKIVTSTGGQGARGLSSHLFAFGPEGELLAVIEAHALTARRTAAASVLAAQALGAGRARHLAVLGSGRQARAQIEAYAAALPLETIAIWARRSEAAAELADFSASLVRSVQIAPSPADAVRGADIVTCATPSEAPLVQGEWIASGAHVDLVGGFRPSMREADDALMARALIVADTPAALAEAGDLVQPIAAGVIKSGDVHWLADVLGGSRLPTGHEITVFKSVGHSAEDLVVTELLLERLGVGAGHGDAASLSPWSAQV